MKGNIPSRKKVMISVKRPFMNYLRKNNRTADLPMQYDDLLRYESSIPLLDQEGNDTLWETVYYSQSDFEDVNQAMKLIYALLKTDGDVEVLDHLTVARIDFCTFGNTKPFRVRIINRLNDNYDHFYIKKADASRVYGLELEWLLSPNHVTYLIDGATLIEEHVAGIPGDDFMKHNLQETTFNQIRIAKEFIKFNERCFVRLLGDMRAYNYVIAITPDIEGSQYRMRPIDFDQQSFEGRKGFYLPQYFRENDPIIYLGMQHMTPETVKQYQLEERSLIAGRVKTSQKQFKALMDVMMKDEISTPEKTRELADGLAHHHKNKRFEDCSTMGEVVLTNIQLLLEKDFKQSILLKPRN
ncbi:hypothetical protein [Phaeodactylibacter sp.]|jgi:hypothetical protein|uniref:hypothetical protein n=1 Tax=Phaeodactylibacter sp. TaxID=1940289 RepID=UPI0025F96566|nr:hypothetical protein [Phaeodactylibacter sp.]MCI4647789.1 hypothetical protein [Phaeodactylibacter sp.]MCI5090517.1 hypothetical protein [Phaeodactylibacter sp.]